MSGKEYLVDVETYWCIEDEKIQVDQDSMVIEVFESVCSAKKRWFDLFGKSILRNWLLDFDNLNEDDVLDLVCWEKQEGARFSSWSPVPEGTQLDDGQQFKTVVSGVLTFSICFQMSSTKNKTFELATKELRTVGAIKTAFINRMRDDISEVVVDPERLSAADLKFEVYEWGFFPLKLGHKRLVSDDEPVTDNLAFEGAFQPWVQLLPLKAGPQQVMTGSCPKSELMASCPVHVVESEFGVALEEVAKNSKLDDQAYKNALETGVISIAPAPTWYPGYKNICLSRWLATHVVPRKLSVIYKIVKRYTGNEIYLRLNLALALDYRPVIYQEKLYISKLLFCIHVLPGYKGSALLSRGVDLSQEEVLAMQNMEYFYFPSFTSASTGTGFTNKNTLMLIDASEGERITLDISNSKHRAFMTEYESEGEVLIGAYSKFKFLGVEGPSNPTGSNPRTVRLKLLDPINDYEEIVDLYQKAKCGDWVAFFNALDGNPHKAQLMIKYRKPASGWTVLHQAAFWGDQQAVNQLVAMGSDPGLKSNAGQSASEVKNEHGSPIDWVAALTYVPQPKPSKCVFQ